MNLYAYTACCQKEEILNFVCIWQSHTILKKVSLIMINLIDMTTTTTTTTSIIAMTT